VISWQVRQGRVTIRCWDSSGTRRISGDEWKS